MLNNKTMDVKTYAQMMHEAKGEKFEMQLKYILNQEDEEIHEDEIPHHIRSEFNIPRNVGNNEINF